MSDGQVIVPTGPGKGQEKTMMEALQAVIGEMRGHSRDLRDTQEPEQAELLERYVTALELIWQQNFRGTIVGPGLPEELRRLAQKYHLALPQKRT
jgi:molybdopterin-biosynthesis enzyme MoeA-like protein